MLPAGIWAAASMMVSGGKGGITITEVNRGKNDWQQKEVFLLTLCLHCWSKLENTFVNKKIWDSGS